MKYVALTGISENVIKELRNNVLLSIEIRNPKNFFSALKLNPGESVFLTSTSSEDVRKGTLGVISKVLKHQVSTHRLVQSNDMYYEERETTLIRLQLQPNCLGRVNKPYDNSIEQPTYVEAEILTCYDAR
ncbi:DUF473 domain-containing protein [Methanosalsum natronophilum]|nr:DUF473 domain-containing protein [Methanosalsum natronophilum]MCS3923806.1 hypothetical protein [Methanosalsum natronophilum]